MQKHNNGGIEISPLLDGIYRKNTILVSGLVIAPVVFVANTVTKALALIFAFSLITFFTIIISSCISRNIVYTIRIILYTLIGALVYVPVASIAMHIFSENVVKEMGIMLPLLITNSMIMTKTELRFFRQKKGKMVVDVLSYIVGFDIVVFFIGFIREIFGTGEISGKILGISLTFPVLIYPFGGFILIGLCAALFRKVQSYFSE